MTSEDLDQKKVNSTSGVGVDGLYSTKFRLLTIAIPTRNRASFLRLNLQQLESELNKVQGASVEIIVSDNCSSDETPSVVSDAINRGLRIKYSRNSENVGWALNFIKCFDQARGKYILLLGDDDILVDGVLAKIIPWLRATDYGVVSLRPYGYEKDFRREYPGTRGGITEYKDSNQYILAINGFFTLTSSHIINRSMLTSVDSRKFASTDLATFHLLLRAALVAEKNLFVSQYSVACKRQNSSGYNFADVFVGQMWRILDAHVKYGLKRETIRTLEARKIICYYPLYLLHSRLDPSFDAKATLHSFNQRFRSRLLFHCWLGPIFGLPRPIAIAWASVLTFLGRIYGGDLRRGFNFFLKRLLLR
jgi:glycosyltransferase involved in cell wall biosynthesis